MEAGHFHALLKAPLTNSKMHVYVVGMKVVAIFNIHNVQPEASDHFRRHTSTLQLLIEGHEISKRLLVLERRLPACNLCFCKKEPKGIHSSLNHLSDIYRLHCGRSG